MKTKGTHRENKRLSKKRKWVKHGEGKRTPSPGQSKFLKEYNKKKLVNAFKKKNG